MVQPDRQYSTAVRTGAREGIDEGLRAFMLGIYNNMAIGLVITAIFAMGTSTLATGNPAIAQVLWGPGIAKYIIMFAPLLFVFGLSAKINSMEPSTARMVFFAFAAVMGISLSWIFLAFTQTSITQTFFITAAAFGSLSLYGYTTKKDLSGWGTFLFMGLIGIILAMVVNLFLGSPALNFAISAIGVLIFAGLTAYDTQKLKNMYAFVASDATAAGRASIMGALTLYLDFINLFMFLLQFLGNRE